MAVDEHLGTWYLVTLYILQALFCAATIDYVGASGEVSRRSSVDIRHRSVRCSGEDVLNRVVRKVVIRRLVGVRGVGRRYRSYRRERRR